MHKYYNIPQERLIISKNIWTKLDSRPKHFWGVVYFGLRFRFRFRIGGRVRVRFLVHLGLGVGLGYGWAQYPTWSESEF